jgi:hypothetical protein
MESANDTAKVECVHGEHFRTCAEAQQVLVEYIGYYNTERRHSCWEVFRRPHSSITGTAHLPGQPRE